MLWPSRVTSNSAGLPPEAATAARSEPTSVTGRRFDLLDHVARPDARRRRRAPTGSTSDHEQALLRRRGRSCFASSGVSGRTARPSRPPLSGALACARLRAAPSAARRAATWTRLLAAVAHDAEADARARLRRRRSGCAARCCRSTGWPFRLTITSPRCRPALSAGLPFVTALTSAPLTSSRPRLCARSEVTPCTVTPSWPRCTCAAVHELGHDRLGHASTGSRSRCRCCRPTARGSAS